MARAKEQRLALGQQLEQAIDALLLEVAIAHRERLVDDQHPNDLRRWQSRAA
jgi:hypothetical protein